MTRLYDIFEKSIDESTSPDGHVTLRLERYHVLDIEFREGRFEQYSASAIAFQCGRALTRLWEKAQDSRDQVLRARGFVVQKEEGFYLNKTSAELIKRRSETEYIGESCDEALSIESSGWRHFRVSINEQVFDEMDENAFIDAFIEASDDLLDDLRMADLDNKREVYKWRLTRTIVQVPSVRCGAPGGSSGSVAWLLFSSRWASSCFHRQRTTSQW